MKRECEGIDMAAQILPFREAKQPRSSPIAHVLRVGGTHRQTGNLFAGGRESAPRAVFESSRVRHQLDLIKALHKAGAQIILDTEIAELAGLVKFQSHSKNAPWANSEA